MLTKRITRSPVRGNRILPSALKAAASIVERLEPRQLLSAVVTSYTIPGADAGDWDGSTAHIITGPDGNEWFTDPTNNAIGKVTPSGTVTEFPLPVHNAPLDDGSGDSGPDDPEPSDIVVGPNGNLWFTETGVDRIGEITTAGVITEFKTPTADSNPVGITVGGDGNLWFAESNNDAIARITPGGAVKEFSLNNLDVSGSDGIALGSDGNVWFIAQDNDGNGAIARITPGGAVSSFSLTTNPDALAAGPDGNLWVGNDDGTIDKVTTAGVVTSFSIPNGQGINSLRAGSDGNLYFTTWGDNQLGIITSAGAMSEFSLPASAMVGGSAIQMNDLSQSPDGTLWYIDSYNPDVGTIDLSNALLATSATVSATAGVSTTSTFASFVDFAGNSTASDYSATVTLSDGTVLNGSITANSNGGFDVSATNDWTIGYDNATVTITDTRDASRVATADSSVSVAAPAATGTGIDISTTAGQLFSGTVATFTGVAANSLSQYSASIDWGDGHDTVGTITVNAQGGFDITGSNRYADSGSYTVTTTLSPFPGGLYPGPIGIGPIVGPLKPITTPPVGTPVPTPITTPVVGAPVSGNTPTTTTGDISTTTSVPGSSGVAVSAPIMLHAPTAALAGGAGSSAIVFPFGGYGATATATAAVASGVANGTGYSVQATSTAPFTGDVASFSLTDPNTDLSHLHATVVWNDPGIRNWYFSLSNSPSAGVITPDGNGGFTVSTTSSFASSGLYHFIVQISDDRLPAGDAGIVAVAYGQIVVDSPFRWLPIFLSANTSSGVAVPDSGGTGSTNSATSTAGTIASNPALGEKVKPISLAPHTLANQTFNGNVGQLKGITGSVADLSGTINWGDGTTSPAVFVGDGNKAVSVKGSHDYAAAGNYSVSVDVTQALVVNGKPSPLYPLHLPTIESAARVTTPGGGGATGHPTPIITTGGIAIIASAGVAFTGPVASFTAPAAAAEVTRTATIAWGDGTHSTGTLNVSSNVVTVSGAHTYRKRGKHTVWITVTQEAVAETRIQKLLAHIKTSAVVT